MVQVKPPAVLFIVFLSLVAKSYSHVGLYYPPARTYALDFLDSARTVPPCGMAPGLGPVTDLAAGSNFTVSWYLGYAHSGGIRIELLIYDSSGNVNKTYFLTSPAGAFIGSSNVTLTSYNVTLPGEVTSCTNCTIRLVRQALNWGPSYLFWSCADVNIVSASKYSSSCGGHGKYDTQSKTCQCDNAYSGPACQFKDDCFSSSDCGANGQCLQITPYSYPQKQCFCQPGWFGIKCEKVSSVASTQFNMALYNNVTLSTSSNVRMYYRILTSSNELEVIIQGQTTSYLGVGWKSLNKVCQSFSLRFPSNNQNTGSASPEPEPEQPAVIGTTKIQPSVVPSAAGQTPVPEGRSEPEPKGEPSPEASAEPETTGSADINGMDCTDIVIGAAANQLSRIGDYYTADRSTPRLDEFYGGIQSLTAAVGSETKGVTTILFRKPLIANELTDNSVTNSLMTVIWAHGQTSIDSPSTGDFYKPDEIKYHATHRGKLSLNFYEQSTTAPSAGSSGGGSWSYPSGCTTASNCYRASWSLNAANDVITFTISSVQPVSMWTAIAFAKEPRMENMDVYAAFMDNNNRGVTFDGWTGTRYEKPKRDSNQNIQNAAVTYASGTLTFTFQRPRNTGDQYDWAFTDTDCYYFIFPVGGGIINNFVDLGPHTATPMISSSKICISAMKNDVSGDTKNSSNVGQPASSVVPVIVAMIAVFLTTEYRRIFS